MELKNGETYNGHLVNCDTWMNIHLREVICTSKVMLLLRSLACFLLSCNLIVMERFDFNWQCRTEIDFGGCLNAIYEAIQSSTFEFLMRCVLCVQC